MEKRLQKIAKIWPKYDLTAGLCMCWRREGVLYFPENAAMINKASYHTIP